MLNVKIMEYYITRKMRCAEAVVYAANDVYDLQLPKESVAMLTGFSGGMCGSGEACGLLSGGVAVLGRMFYEKLGPDFPPAVAEFHRRFTEAFDAAACPPVKERYATPEARCSAVVDTFAKLMTDYIAELQARCPKD